MSDVNMKTALDNWGKVPPEWIIALAEACDRTSQGKAAERLKVSGAMVNQVIKNAYKGRLDRIEARVRGELMKETVACPVLGDISKRKCQDHQGRKYKPTNPLRVKLFTACKTCPNRREQ